MQKCCLILFIVFQSFSSLSQSSDSTYLSTHTHEVELDGKEQFLFFDKNFYSQQLFLFGENHGSAQPHVLDVELFKHLYFKEKVRHYLAEVDVIKAWMLNQYLQDGDERWLTKVFKSWKAESAQWASEDNWNKYKKLRIFYQTLPKQQRFTIVGIDVIQDYSLVNEYLSNLFKSNISKLTDAKIFVEIADTIQYNNKRILGVLARKIATDFNTNPLYKKTLKKNFSDFEIFINSAGYVGNGMYRDSIMFRIFDDIVTKKKMQGAKMYGFLGFYHTLQISYEGRNTFAACVKKFSSIKNVMSLQMLAIDSKVMLPYNDELKKMMPATYITQLRKENPDFAATEKYIPYDLSNDKSMMKVDGIEVLKKTTTANTVCFIQLNGNTSPYNSNKKLGEVSGFQTIKMTDKTNVTTDAFQYVVLFRNSPAAKPLQ